MTTGADARSAADADTIALQPGVIGADANRRLARYGRKIGPDPASIDTAKIGGIAANNASGMCCGTAQNSYQTLAGHARRPCRRHAARHARCGEPRRIPSRGAKISSAELAALAKRDARQRGAGRAHPPQVPDQEHHRLQPERTGRLRRPDRHPRPSDDRLGGHARLHLRDHLPHRAGTRRQGQRADPIRQSRNGLPRGDCG